MLCLRCKVVMSTEFMSMANVLVPCRCSENVFKQNAVAPYCSESLNHLHVISSMYRPFMLWLWFPTDQLSCCSNLVYANYSPMIWSNLIAFWLLVCYIHVQHACSLDCSYMCGTKGIMHRSWSEARRQSSCSGASGLKESVRTIRGKSKPDKLILKMFRHILV